MTMTPLVKKRVMNNQLVHFGQAMRQKFADANIRHLCLMHVDPGFRNGNNTLIFVDLLRPSNHVAISFKIELYGERNMPDPSKEDVVDRMVDWMTIHYPRLYHNVHLCSIETQLERTEFGYADSKAEHMGSTMHSLLRSWGIPVQHFDVGIVHRAYPEIYPPFVPDSGKSKQQNSAARYAHNKKCSSAFMEHSVALHSFEREVAAMDMTSHIERRIRNEVTGSTEKKWDDYGDGIIPALVMAGYVTDTPLLDARLLNEHEGDQTLLYLIVFPTATFVQQDVAVYREGPHAILLLFKHEAFPFFPYLRRIARQTLMVEDNRRFSSWDDLSMELGLCIVDLSAA